jgi:DNA-binding transcriptional MocR family regulator
MNETAADAALLGALSTGNGSRPATLQARIVRVLGRQLGDGDGDCPTLRVLARELGVSRPAVRDALNALRRKGWIEDRGAMVTATPAVGRNVRRRVALTPPAGFDLGATLAA